jgi:pimeloyl-ACP methyl ester carboxylesterase
MMVVGARRRRAVFASRQEAYDNYAGKPPLDALTPEALHAYVDHGFLDRPDGSVELACHPEQEAGIFEGGAGQDAFALLGEVPCPVLVMAGRRTRTRPA